MKIAALKESVLEIPGNLVCNGHKIWMRGVIMDYTNTSQRDKRAVLENAVINKSPEEVSLLYSQLGHVENSSRALGLACRFRGLAYVRALVEGGADFTYERPEGGSYYNINYRLSLLERNGALGVAFFLDKKDACFAANVMATDRKTNFPILPMEQRMEVVKYLYEHREAVVLDEEELLFYAIMSGSRRIAAFLKECGVALSEKRITGITSDGRSWEWMEFCSMLEHLGDAQYIEAVGSIAKEIGGKKLHYTESIYWGNCNDFHKQYRLYKPEFFQFVLEHFNQKKMNKKQFMEGAIDRNSVQCLAVCAENGWLDLPRKRDQMIQYASDKDKTECAAWLLEFKNRTADFAAEREKAEKKMMRELNANPNSVTELRKTWSFEKREDGTLIIMRYKGKKTEIDVPEKIGDGVVTAIGDWAFSPGASRLKVEQREFLRRSITRVTLPDTIETIGEGAFWGCWALEQVQIPDRVTAIGQRAFADCRSLSLTKLPENITAISNELFSYCHVLKEVTIPPTVTTIGKWAFQGCTALTTVIVPEGVLEIGQLVFQGCKNLKSVVLPQSVQKIKNYTYNKKTGPQTIFGNNEVVTVTVPPKSYAEKYCRRNNIRHVVEE